MNNPDDKLIDEVIKKILKIEQEASNTTKRETTKEIVGKIASIIEEATDDYKRDNVSEL